MVAGKGYTSGRRSRQQQFKGQRNMMRLSMFVSFSECSFFPIHISSFFLVAFYGIDVEGLIVCAYARFFISSSFLVYILFKDEKISAARHGMAWYGMTRYGERGGTWFTKRPVEVAVVFRAATEKRPKRLFG